MVNYYEILKVSPKASRLEIKSAYRRLARELHPDKNNGSEDTARAFAAIAEAWEVLGNPKERARYDKQLIHASVSNGNGNSVFTSQNFHARRWRQLVYEHRYNEIINRMIMEERREAMALQRIIFPMVALFVSVMLIAAFKPVAFSNAPILIQIVTVSLFVAGTIHLFGRIREGLERFTYDEDDIHESILDDTETAAKPYSRLLAGAFLAVGLLACVGVGLLIGNYTAFAATMMPRMFSTELYIEAFLYPPIFVLLVDLVHLFALRVDN